MSFPFLSLPVDLRLEIYHLCLGGRAIHINWPGLGRTVCKTALSEEDIYAKCQASEQLPYMISDADSIWRHHDQCKKQVPAAVLDLNLLLSCKQIYNEAWRTPWKTSLFMSFGRDSLYDCFDRFLNARQIGALQSLQIFENCSGRDISFKHSPNSGRPREDELLLPTAHALVELQKLNIVLEYGVLLPQTHDLEERRADAERQDNRLDWLTSFSACPKLQQVNVMIWAALPPLAPSHPHDELVSTADLIARGKELKDWSERTEARVWEAVRRTRLQLASEAEAGA